MDDLGQRYFTEHRLAELFVFIFRQLEVLFAAFITITIAYTARRKLENIDSRVRVIVAATILSVFICASIYKDAMTRGPDSGFWSFIFPDEFEGAAFAGFVGSVAFFLIVGLAVAVFSLAKPEDEMFESRARILFRKQSGKHIDYIVSKMKNMFEHYTERCEACISIIEFDKERNMFYLEAREEAIIKSYIDDEETQYASAFKWEKVTQNINGGIKNKLFFLRVNSRIVAMREFDDKINESISTTIERGGECAVEYKVGFWFKANDEPYTHTPVRYTQYMKIIVENNIMDGQSLNFKLCADDGVRVEREQIVNAGDRVTLLTASDLKPGQVSCKFSIVPLEKAGLATICVYGLAIFVVQTAIV